MNVSDRPGDGSYRFRWLGSGPIPASADLRHCGWVLDDHRDAAAECIGLIDAGDLDGAAWREVLCVYNAEMRHFVVVTGVRRAQERTRLLQAGFGDAVSDAIDIDELGARAARTAELGKWLPRQRSFGTLELDLLAREAYGFGKPLNLNPREFALLWRLSDSPNHSVSKQALIEDVWRMGFVPETNSIAVHMSRLRRKLSFAGLQGLIETAFQGGYCLRLPEDRLAQVPRPTAAPEPLSGHASDGAMNGCSAHV